MRRVDLSQKRKIAFVCSGGGAKAAAFHLGVALALQDRGFRFIGGLSSEKTEPARAPKKEIGTYVGSSAGSMVCTFLAAGFSMDEIVDSYIGRKKTKFSKSKLPKLTYPKMFTLNKTSKIDLKSILQWKDLFSQLRGWDSFISLKWLKTSGIFSTSGIEAYVREEVLKYNSFEDYISELFIVATRLNHSRKVVFGKYKWHPPSGDPSCRYENQVSISQACAASTALPFIFTPYSIEEKKGKKIDYIDGEIRDTLSTHVAVDAGCDLIFTSYTHQPYHYDSVVGSLSKHGLPSILVQSIYLMIEQKINLHKNYEMTKAKAVDTMKDYLQTLDLKDEVRAGIVRVLESELGYRSAVDVVDIHPDSQDSAMFFGEHFTLSTKKLSEYVRSGFRAAHKAMEKIEFISDSDASLDASSEKIG